MINFEDYLQKCFMLSSSSEPTNFIRSQFDYGVRQRRAVRGYPTYTVVMVLEYYELVDFQRFWFDLDEGTDEWTTDAVIHGNNINNKRCRFTSGYTLTELGTSKYKISVPMELLEIITDEPGEPGSPTNCPLIPNNTIIAREGLMPC